jgi:1,4-alpha-glucan branching enzyme
MPYVEGFGTWPFGEEWLWEAIVSSYLPLLKVLGRAPITVSLTPVLCDQLEAPGAMERCIEFLEQIRPESHRLDIEEFRRDGHRELAVALERSAGDYARAASELMALGGGLLGPIGKHARWTSAATHPVLPLLATDAMIALQVQTGIVSHRRRFGGWEGGFWLPECGYGSWLEPLLEEAGVRSTCVELTSLFGEGDTRHLRPLESTAGPVLWPIDRQTMSLVWSARGYPAAGAYRDYHRLSTHHHRVWNNDGDAYDFDDALELTRVHAQDFVSRVLDRVRDGGVCVCALDTELLGHWWYEGPQWLGAVLDECSYQGLRLTALDDALEHHEPVPAPDEIEVSSWGERGDLRTWSGPRVAEMAFRARAAELKLVAGRRSPTDREIRELMALQSSDWAFLTYRDLAGDYPRQRFEGHSQALESAIDDGADGQLRNLAPDLVAWPG